MKSVTPLYFVVVMMMFSSVVAGSDLLIGESKERKQSDLLASCEALKTHPSSERASSCRYYIYGFIDAGQVTSEINAEQLKEGDNSSPSFIERAYRTRVGQLDERTKTKETLLKPFCVPEKESRQRVIGRLTKHLPNSMDTSKMLSIAVYRGLKTEYPCD